MRRIIVSLLTFLLALSLSVSPAAAGTQVSANINAPAKVTGFEFEPNDAKEDAGTIVPEDGVEGILQDNYDADFYRIVLPYKGTVNFFSKLGKDDPTNFSYWNRHELVLYDVKGNELATSSNVFDTNYFETIESFLEKGVYYVAVKSSDKGTLPLNNQEYILFTTTDFVSDLTVDSITPNLASPQIERQPITFTATASKAGLEFQYTIQDKVVRGFNTSPTYTWTPTDPGTYTVKVTARDPIYHTVTAEKEITYKIVAYTPDFAVTALTPNIASPYIPGKAITFTTTANKTGLQYQFSVNGKVVQAFATKNTYTWTSGSIGKYTIKVDARRAQYPNRIVSKSITYEIKNPNVYIQSLTSNAASPYPVNSYIKWTAGASGINLEYNFAVYKGGVWKTVQGYSSKNYYTWRPTSSGSYLVKVTVRSKASGKTGSKTVGYTIFTPSSFTTPTLKANKGLMQLEDTNFIFTAASTGSYLEYRFKVNNGHGWVVVKNFSASRTFSYTPSSEGTYQIAVDVRQRGTTTVKTKTLTLDIREAPYNYMSWYYSYYYDAGYIDVYNYGRNSLKITKIEIFQNGTLAATQKPTTFILNGYRSNRFYIAPPVYLYNITNIRITYTFDGLSYTRNLYSSY